LIAVWTIRRAEANAAFFYLTLFTRPDLPEGFLSINETVAVREIALALAAILSARRGVKRLGRTAVDARILSSNEEPTSEEAPEPMDERWIRRLKRRRRQQDERGATQIRSIPGFLMRLLARPKISS
jgi:hypothetical protein